MCTTGSSDFHLPSKRPGSSVTKRVLVSRTSLTVSPSRSLHHITFTSPSKAKNCVAFVDSGLDANLMDLNMAKVEFFQLSKPLEASALDG